MEVKVYIYTVKNTVYRNTPGEQYFTVSMVIHTVTTETIKYCSPGVFSYTAFFTVYRGSWWFGQYKILSMYVPKLRMIFWLI